MKKIAICMAFVMLLLTGCNARKADTRNFDAMGVAVEFSLWGKDKAAAADDVKELILELEYRWSSANINSVPSQMNDKGSVLYLEDMDYLDQVEALTLRTNGNFAYMMNSVVELWGFVSGNYQVPTQEALEQALQEEKWNVDAVMRGYIGRRIVALLQTMNVDRGIVYMGGNVQTYGENKGGAPWNISIANPKGGDPVGAVSVQGTMAVVTVGGYQRCFEKDGGTYHHILDPHTGMPAQSGLASVTVICEDGVVADVMSRAMYVMGLEAATEFWQGSDDFQAVFVLEDGSIYATEGVVLNGCEFTTISR